MILCTDNIMSLPSNICIVLPQNTIVGRTRRDCIRNYKKYQKQPGVKYVESMFAIKKEYTQECWHVKVTKAK